MNQIHGDTNQKPQKLIADLAEWNNPTDVFQEISKSNPVDSIVSFQTINFLGEPFYQVRFFSNGQQKISLVNAKKGLIRLPLSEKEAVQLAKEIFYA